MYYEELEQRTREHRSALMREAEQARLGGITDAAPLAQISCVGRNAPAAPFA